MMITFYDLLGIDPSQLGAADAAALLWPNDTITQTAGYHATGVDDRLAIVTFLQSVLAFSNVRPGADGRLVLGTGQPGQITLLADVTVYGIDMPPKANTLYLRSLPDIGLNLMNTSAPARCYFASDGRGYELIIENLPLLVTFKPSFLTPPAGVGTVGDLLQFDSSQPDSLQVVLNPGPVDGTQVALMARFHLTPEGDVIFEASVPHCENSVVFLGLPATAIYDLLIIPSPRRIEYVEWARHPIDGFLLTPPTSGALAFRSIDFDFTKPPFSDLASDIGSRTLSAPAIELVCEDVVFNAFSPLLVLPVPSHGTFGFRKKVVDRTDVAKAFSLDDGPVQFLLYPRDSNPGDDGRWVLVINQFQLQTGVPPIVQFQTAFVYQQANAPSEAATLAIADDWTLQVGISSASPSPVKTTIAGLDVSVQTLKLGLGLGRLAKGEHWSDSWQMLVDIVATSHPSDDSSPGLLSRLLAKIPVHFASLTGKPISTILRDVGWSFGRPSFTGLAMPDGAQLMFGQSKSIRLIVEEMAMVEDPDGIERFAFSGGVALGFGGGDAVQPSGIPQENQKNGFGIRVRRLRFRPQWPPDDWKCDGLSLNIRFGTILIAGFGYITDDIIDGVQIHEFGFGVQAQAELLGNTYTLGAMFLKGSRHPVSATDQTTPSFDYFLASLVVGILPVGAIGLYSVRLLFAENMTPNLGTTTADNKGLQLYLWHRDHDSAIDMPRDRNLADWLPQDHALAAGLGCGLAITGLGKVVHLDIFVMVSLTESDAAVLLSLQAYLLKIKRPVAFIAGETDDATQQWVLTGGIELAVADFIAGGGDLPSWLPDWITKLATLTGTIYIAHPPTTFAIGQLSDQRTWLAFKANFDALGLKGNLMFGVCLQYVDGGPWGFGAVVTASLGANWHIGKWALFGSAALTFGSWKTGSNSSGVAVSVQFGFRIDLFSIINLGADVTLKGSYLGMHPGTFTWSAQLRLDTPWWMPDVTFSIQNAGPSPQPYDLPTSTRALGAPAAIAPSTQADTALLAPPLSDGISDATHLYTFNELTGVAGAPLGDTHERDDVPIVATDATIAINFASPVSNDMGVGPDTYGATGDAGVQNVQDLTVRYGLQSIAVRRSPLFGPDAGTWSDFVTATDTALDLSGTVHTAPALSFRWDVDIRANGTLSPTRLLLNGATPYTFTIGGAQHDEEATRNDAGYPCCKTALKQRGGMPLHELAFATTIPGTRLPRSAQFLAGGGWWQWTNSPTPLAASSFAWVSLATSATIGRIDFAEPAMTFSIDLDWVLGAGALVIEGYSGVTLVAQLSLEASAANSGVQQITATVAAPFTCVTIRTVAAPGAAIAQISRMWYVTLADYISFQGAERRCQSSSATGGGGKLAFLPNTDYEVTVTTEIRLSHKSQGTRSLTLSEPLYFRTKGLPGLNAVANVGDELVPYVESTYPQSRSTPLYCAEPIALAFSEGMSTLLPVDRIPAPTDPPEKSQVMELVLNVDRVVSTDGLKRLTVPTNDWITAHRAGPPRKGWTAVGVFGGVIAGVATRRAVSVDPLIVRYQTVVDSTVTCGQDPLQSSQLLTHAPIAADGTAGLWQPTAGFRATVRQKDGPYASRSSFDTFDAGAFISQSDGADPPAGRWRVSVEGQLTAPAAGNGRQYASFGDLTWNHLQLHVRLVPDGVPAGVAVGVAGGSPVPHAVLATIESDPGGVSLVLRARAGGVETELGRQPLTLSDGVVTLHVTAFDDFVRAEVGMVSVEAARGAIRDGRVALVAEGATMFAGVIVDGLDMYRYDFVSSRYQSFQEHMDSFDGTLSALAPGAAGGVPTPVAAILSARSADIAAAMRADADPQQRQALATDVVSALALPLRQRRERVTISRIVEASGTVGLLIEGPEPMPLSTDVTASLVHHVVIHHWPPYGGENAYTARLARVRFDARSISVPLSDAPAFQPGDRLVRVTQTDDAPAFAIYDMPRRTAGAVRAVGALRETVVPALGVRPELDALRGAPDGAAGNGFGIQTIDVPVTLTALTNGDETTLLLLPVDSTGASLALHSGGYTLTLRVQRTRWRTSVSDPSAIYDQSRAIALAW
jgi:hypothetical protein